MEVIDDIIRDLDLESESTHQKHMDKVVSLVGALSASMVGLALLIGAALA